jgi:PAS domain S-box-containing protein
VLCPYRLGDLKTSTHRNNEGELESRDRGLEGRGIPGLHFTRFLSEEQMKSSSQQLIQDRIRELRENTDFVVALFEGLIGYAIIAADFDGNVIAYNEGARQIYGYAPEEIIGKQSMEVFFPQEFVQAGKLQQAIDDLIRKGRFSYEGEKVRKNGERFPAQILFTLTRDMNGRMVGFIEIVEDITERKRAEEVLRQSEANFRNVIIKNADGIIIVDRNGVVRFVNPAGESLLGRKLEELIGEVFGFPMVLGEATELDIARTGGEAAVAEMRVVDGEWGGESVYLASLRDITERKRAEQRESELRQELHLTSRLASVGELAAGVAHEINNPLTAVIGFSELLIGKDIPEDIKQFLEIISDNAQRVAKIVMNLLTFARPREPGKEYVDINSIISRVVDLRTYEMRSSNIEVTTQLASDLPWTMVDTGQLQQVFLNIIINAEQAMVKAHNKGNLLIKTQQVDSYIRVSFQDDGPGIAPENLDKIFNPFFTTKGVGEGTGLGLSISYGIIKEHEGRIYAQSELGKGATFVVELPMVAQPQPLESAEPPGEEPKRVTGAKIIVVDDEASICQFLNSVLTQEGHKVETISNASDALERLKHDRYDLILLDIKMPGMYGTEFYGHIEKIDPSLQKRVVFITGDTMAPDTRNFLNETKALYVSKPFKLEQLMREINGILTLNKREVSTDEKR